MHVEKEMQQLRQEVSALGLADVMVDRICAARISRRELAELVGEGKTDLERALGESVKTGSDQGCIVQREWLASWLLRYRDRRIAQGKVYVFEQSSVIFRDHFAAMQRFLGSGRMRGRC